jgi:hypothetical protein
MNAFRRLHPLLLSTWLALHVVGGLYLMSRFAMANFPGMYRSFQEMYLRLRSIHETLSWLPDNFYAALIAGWIVVALALYLTSFVLRKSLAKYCKTDHALEALRWFLRSRRIRLFVVLLLALAAITLVFPIATVPLLIVSLAALGLSFHQPFLEDQRLPNDSQSLWSMARGFFLFILLSTILALCSYALSQLISQSVMPITYVASLVWYVGQSALEGLIVAAAIFGLRQLRHHRPTLRRFFSPRYLITWIRLDYFGLLATLWLAPPLMVSAFFMWFAYPTIKYQTQIDGTQISWWLGAFARAADAFTKYWFLATVPPVLALGTLIHAKIAFELERSEQRD